MIKMTADQRMIQHEHNSHLGRIYMIKSCARSILKSSTVIPEMKAYAVEIEALAELMLTAVNHRINADGSVTEVKWSIKDVKVR